MWSHSLGPVAYLDLKESLHREELHQTLLDGAQEEAHVPIPQVGLDPKEILDDTAVTLSLVEEKLDICGQIGHLFRSQPLWKGKTQRLSGEPDQTARHNGHQPQSSRRYRGPDELSFMAHLGWK